jgi:hypothetical protein
LNREGAEYAEEGAEKNTMEKTGLLKIGQLKKW